MKCWLLASCLTIQPMNKRNMTERALAVSVPGGKLIGVRSGCGRPLLVLHGGPAVNDYSDWFAAELAGWDAFRYTQRGVAPSVTEGPFTIEQHVSDALAVLDQHGVAAATVLGHSWGGYLAMQLTARAPARVNALVLADTLGAVGDGGLAGFGSALEARATPETRTRIAELDDLIATSKEHEAAVALEYFRLEWPGYFAVPAQAPPVPDTVRVNPEGFEQTSASVAQAAERGDLPGLLRGFTGPVEVVAGECSPLPRQAAESTTAVFPDARLTIVPGTGHQLWHEAPGCLAAALSRVAARLA
jgi:pimeloyl-ACP methyl ester carboxylesterase